MQLFHCFSSIEIVKLITMSDKNQWQRIVITKNNQLRSNHTQKRKRNGRVRFQTSKLKHQKISTSTFVSFLAKFLSIFTLSHNNISEIIALKNPRIFPLTKNNMESIFVRQLNFFTGERSSKFKGITSVGSFPDFHILNFLLPTGC